VRNLSTTTIALGLDGPVLNTVDEFGTFWRVPPRGFTGWGEPASTLRPVQKPRQSGAWAGKSSNVARTIGVSGTITALTPALLNAAIEQLITAVTNAAFRFTVTESGASRWVAARRQGETIAVKVTALVASFSIQVVSLDSRKFGETLTGSTLLPVTAGGLTVPFTLPVSIASTVVSGQIALFNPGNEVGPVVLRIDGPVGGPQITHSGTGRPLVFASSLALAAGEWLTVDMDKRTAMANDQASRSTYITSREWSGFDPGLNSWGFSATGYDAGAKLTVMATPASK